MEALELLQKKLKGNFYSRFSVGDTWGFYFDGFWLITYDVISKNENGINSFLINGYTPYKEAVDKEDIAKSTIVASCLRKNIINLSLASDSSLMIEFENGVQLVFPTNTKFVDWQWAINNNGEDPYQSCIIGCFNAGEIQIKNC